MSALCSGTHQLFIPRLILYNGNEYGLLLMAFKTFAMIKEFVKVILLVAYLRYW